MVEGVPLVLVVVVVVGGENACHMVITQVLAGWDWRGMVKATSVLMRIRREVTTGEGG